jgi:hypothetical protein
VISVLILVDIFWPMIGRAHLGTASSVGGISILHQGGGGGGG